VHCRGFVLNRKGEHVLCVRFTALVCPLAYKPLDIAGQRAHDAESTDIGEPGAAETAPALDPPEVPDGSEATLR